MIATLQSLRFVFLVMIFLSHFAYHGIGAWDAFGDCGVAFFFMLSGFVLSVGYGPRLSDHSFSFSTFMRRRLIKLYPLHLLCLVFYLIVSHSGFGIPVLLNALLLQSWIPDPDIYFSCNSVSWFLSSLMFCYLVFPVAYRCVSWRWLSALLALYLAVCLLVPESHVNAVLYIHPLLRFVDFYIGIVLARVYENGYPRSLPGWAEPLTVVLLLLALMAYPYLDVKFRNAPLFWLVLVPLILVFAKGQGGLSSLLNRKPMQLLASLTMPAYMIHQMLLGILLARLPEMPAGLMLFVCLLTVLVMSWCIERFFLRQIERLG
ncbi:MAG: acyltransferase [Prevotella sp.]|nr:acyltransferase [Prevotella sp.]